MNIMQPAYKILPIPDPHDHMEVLKHLERIGRVCYKSEKKITEESCKDFLEKIKNRKHWAMLEHYIFAFSVPKYIFEDIFNPSRFTPDNVDLINKMAFIQGTFWEDAPREEWKYIVSASATALNYLWECNCYKDSTDDGLVVLCNFMINEYPELMRDPKTYPEGHIIGRLCDTSIKFISRADLRSMPRNIALCHDFMSVWFNVDRGVTHELVRHRPCSWAQESTRYCNYSSGNFGNEISVIDPSFFPTIDGKEDDSLVRKTWRRAMEAAQMFYNDLIGYGSVPQQARTVLPQSTKAEIIMTSRMYEMIHFFKMRADKAAHPQMQEVAVPLARECYESDPELFDEIKDRAYLFDKEDD